MDFDTEFPWIKFGILSVAFMFLIWKMGGNLSLLWRFMFVLTAPVGVYFALSGRRIHK